MTVLCPYCHLPKPGDHGISGACYDAQQAAMLMLLSNIGERAPCSVCQALVYWVRHKNGKRTPYTAAGLNHFIDCPKAAQFSTRKKVS